MINIIKTRFNVNFKHLNNHLSNKHLDDDWLNYRLNIFLKYCAPSVLGQDRGDFYWIISFDKNTKDSFIKKITNLDNRIKGIKIKNQEQEFLKDLEKKYKNFIFTRIDSDDCFRKNFLNNIYDFSKANEEKKEFLIDINFYVLKYQTNYFYKKEMPNNIASHFVSLFTKNINSNIYIQHGIIANLYKYNRIDDYLAIEVVHDSNIKNKINKKALCEIDYNELNNFHISYEQ